MIGAYSLGAYSLERPMLDLLAHLLVLDRVGSYSLGTYMLRAYSLERPILDLLRHLLFLKEVRGSFNMHVVQRTMPIKDISRFALISNGIDV